MPIREGIIGMLFDDSNVLTIEKTNVISGCTFLIQLSEAKVTCRDTKTFLEESNMCI